MSVPPWSLFAIAAWLLLFGAFRIGVGLRGRRQQAENDAPRGLLALSWRRHVVFGVFYLAVGGYLVIMGLGYGVPTAMQADEPVSLPPQRADHLVVD